MKFERNRFGRSEGTCVRDVVGRFERERGRFPQVQAHHRRDPRQGVPHQLSRYGHHHRQIALDDQKEAGWTNYD